MTIVDHQNHHVFQPLLYQVATAGLSPADIAAPIRSIVRHQSATQVILDQVTGVDTEARAVKLAAGDPLRYDQLILATGVRHSYFGHEEWAVDAPGLKTLDDATRIRRLILIAPSPTSGSSPLTSCFRLRIPRREAPPVWLARAAGAHLNRNNEVCLTYDIRALRRVARVVITPNLDVTVQKWGSA